MLVLCLLLLLGPGAGPRGSVAEPPARTADDASLEAYLARLRKERAKALERLSGPVALLVEKLEAHGRPSPANETERLRAELDGLGPDAALLLLPFIDPGAEPRKAQIFRADEITSALARMESGAITPRLFELSSSATPRGRENAVRLLGHAPQRDSASAHLTAIFQEAKGSLRLAAVQALARIGGPGNTNVLESALTDPDAAVVGEVLRALASARSQDAAPAVLTLAGRVPEAAQVVEPLLAYYQACPASFDAAVAAAWIQLVGSGETKVADRILLLNALPDFDPDLDSKQKKVLEQLEEASDQALREAALVALARMGDRGAKRTVLKVYDKLVSENERFAPAWEQRGTVLMRLGEYGDASKDFKSSIEILTKAGRFVSQELHINLARAYCLDGKLRQAADALESARLTKNWLRQVYEDQAFRELIDNSRYGKLFDSVR